MEMMSVDDSGCIIGINIEDTDGSVLASSATTFDSFYGSPSSPFSPSELSPFNSSATFDFPHTPPQRSITRRSSDSASSFQMPQFHHSPSMPSTPDFSSNATFHNPSPLRVDTNMELASPFLSPMSTYSSAAFGSPHDDDYLSPYANPQSTFSNSTSSLESLLLTPEDAQTRGRSLGRDQGLLSPIQARSRDSSVSSITRLAPPFADDCDPASPAPSYMSDAFDSDFTSMMLNSPSEMPKPLEPGGCLDPRVELAASDNDESSPAPERTSGRFRKNVASEAVKKASADRRKHAAPHKCEKCGQTFTAKHNLINHGNSHAGLKPFKCKYCPGTFGTSGVLARHVKKRHDDMESDDESPRARVKPRRVNKRASS
ncbi:hypothetical protein BDZ89DRAFT_1074121 [Hymenopellis radicata]|nr:hypothetical protein BDZ89DRAFT_1074121 [Hymenopellis radicata]